MAALHFVIPLNFLANPLQRLLLRGEYRSSRPMNDIIRNHTSCYRDHVEHKQIKYGPSCMLNQEPSSPLICAPVHAVIIIIAFSLIKKGVMQDNACKCS